MGEEKKQQKRTKDELLGKDYDGIQEYDNDMPGWFNWLFYLTILWAFVYIMHYQVLGTGMTQYDEYMTSIDSTYKPHSPGAIAFAFPAYDGPYAGADSPSQLQLASMLGEAGAVGGAMQQEIDMSVTPDMSDGALASGATIFKNNCVSCHGPQGGGGIGPNLTDVYWIHGGSFPEVVHTVNYGVPSKGMIAWKTQLKPEEVIQVSSFVRSLQGTSPANAKEPQGDPYDPSTEEAPVAESEDTGEEQAS